MGSAQQGLGQCQGTSCDLSLDWTFDLSASYATDGPHSIDIVTTSFGGLTADEHELITVSHLASLPPQGLDIAASQPNLGDQPNQRIDGAGQGDRAGQSVTPIGDINGDGLDDYLIGHRRLGSTRPARPWRGRPTWSTATPRGCRPISLLSAAVFRHVDVVVRRDRWG